MKDENKKRNLGLKPVYRSIKLVFTASPLSFIIKLLFALSVGITGSLLTPANAYLFSSAEKAAAGECNVSRIWLGAAFALSAMLVSGLLSTFTKLISNKINQKFTSGVLRYFYNKVKYISPIKFEDSSFILTLDKATRSTTFVVNYVDRLMQSVCSFFAYFILMSGYLISMDISLILTLFLTFSRAFRCILYCRE